MQHSSEIRIVAGETRKMVLLNEPSLSLTITQEEGSRLVLHIVDLGESRKSKGASEHSDKCRKRVNDITVRQLGQGCTTELYGLAYVRGTDEVTIHTHVFHEVGRGVSRQLLKFVLDDEAKGDFYGELRIAKDAQQVDAQQTNRNLLLSAKATISTRPQLEIYADDVKASHGATTGQLDEAALFYMQQRGISRDRARNMLIGAFMKDVVLTIDDEAQRNELIETIDGIVE